LEYLNVKKEQDNYEQSKLLELEAPVFKLIYSRELQLSQFGFGYDTILFYALTDLAGKYFGALDDLVKVNVVDED